MQHRGQVQSGLLARDIGSGNEFVECDVDRLVTARESDSVTAVARGEYQRLVVESRGDPVLAGGKSAAAAEQVD